MSRAPRPADESILTPRHWLDIGIYGALITLATLGAFWFALEWLRLPPAEAVTISFLTLAFAQLWHVFNMRAAESGLLRNDIIGNVYVWGALALCIGLLLAAVYLPALGMVLDIVAPTATAWLVIVAASLTPYIVGQGYLFVRGHRRGSS